MYHLYKFLPYCLVIYLSKKYGERFVINTRSYNWNSASARVVVCPFKGHYIEVQDD